MLGIFGKKKTGGGAPELEAIVNSEREKIKDRHASVLMLAKQLYEWWVNDLEGSVTRPGLRSLAENAWVAAEIWYEVADERDPFKDEPCQ